MLWSLLKIVLFLAAIAGLTAGAGYLVEAQGGVRIAVAGTEYTLGLLDAVVALVVLIVAVWVVLRLVGLVLAFVRFIAGDETALTRYFARNRERKGYDALAEGMMALASGEGRLALAKAARAERFLHRPDLTTLLTAQAAEQAGDGVKAEAAYRRLLADDRTRFVGVRGLMKQRLADGDTDTALKLAEKAFALKPRHEETQDVLLKLQAGAHDWTAARRTLGAKLKHGGLPRDVHWRRDAVLALSEAKDILDEEKPIEAREAAILANRMSPDLIPAAAMASDALVAQGKAKQATRILRKAWEASPHPDLAAAFARIAPDETPAERVRRFGVLTGLHRGNPETRMLEAELLIAAEDFPAARKALGGLAETDPAPRSLTIMAAIERGSGADDMVVKGWLARALTAPRGPAWTCDACERVHAQWQPVCDNCGGFDTLSWRRPDAGEAPMPAGAEMLPLIVGGSAPPPHGPTAEAEPAEDEEPEHVTGAPAETANSDAPPADYVIESEASESRRTGAGKDAT